MAYKRSKGVNVTLGAIVMFLLVLFVFNAVLEAIPITEGSSIGLGEEINFTLDESAISLSQNNLVADSTEITCPDVLMTEDEDYTVDDSAGTITFLNDSLSIVNDSYTSLHDENVYLWSAENELVWADSSTFVTFNCSDYAEVWTVGNYTLNDSLAYINVSSAGDMLNNTEYCFNTTGTRMYDGAECTIEYLFYTEDGEGSTFFAMAVVFAQTLLPVIGILGIYFLVRRDLRRSKMM